MIPLNAAQVQRATGATRANAELFLPFIQGTCKAYSITSPRRIAGFLAQIGVESQGLSKLEENLNYSTEALIKRFGRHRISVEDAQRFGRRPGQRADQQALANTLYGGPWGLKNLGNVKPGDGWRHRGMGAKHLTGLANHRRCGEAIGEDFVGHPERLLLPVNAALSAGWFWADKGLNAIADAGDIERMSLVVNGGTNGLPERIALWNQNLQVFA
jgi:putative chitinase